MLSAEDRQGLQQLFEDEASRKWEALGLSRDDIAAAVNAVDAWVDANAASFNQALPEPARSELTAIQKTKLLYLVCRRRWEVT